MAKRKYLKDYVVNEYIDEKGHVTRDTQYIGEPYGFKYGLGRAKRSAKLTLFLSIAEWVCFFICCWFEGSAMRTIYVALPFAFTALPLFLMTRASVNTLRSAEPMKRGEAEKIASNMPAASLASGLLPLISFLGCAVTMALGGTADWLFIALSAVMVICAALAFTRRRDFAVETKK